MRVLGGGCAFGQVLGMWRKRGCVGWRGNVLGKGLLSDDVGGLRGGVGGVWSVGDIGRLCWSGSWVVVGCCVGCR